MSYRERLKPLPLRVTPWPDDTLPGFIVRLGERNGCRNTLVPFAHAVGMPFLTLTAAASRTFDLVGLATASGVSIGRLRSMAYWPEDDERPIFRGHPLGRSMLATSRRVVCPDCLAALPYHRAAWDLSLAGVCPEHGIALVAVCRGCEQRIRWSTPGIRHCRCGFDLVRSARRPVPADELAGTVAMYHVLGLPCPASPRPPSLPSTMVSIGADVLLTQMIYLGWDGSGISGSPNITGIARRRNDIPAVLTRGYERMLSWSWECDDIVQPVRRHRVLHGIGKRRLRS